MIARSATTASGEIPGFTPAFGAPDAVENNRLKLHIFVDESSVEVFSNDGLLSITSETFVNPLNTGVVLFAEKGAVRVSHLEIYALANVWSKTREKFTHASDFSFCR